MEEVDAKADKEIEVKHLQDDSEVEADDAEARAQAEAEVEVIAFS